MSPQNPLHTLWIPVLTCLGTAAMTLATHAADSPTRLPEVLVTGQGDKKETTSYKTESTSLTKYTQPIVDTPQAISVVPKQVLEDQHATTMRDALRNVAGISIAAGEGGAQGDNLTLRGFSARNDIFLDGMRDFGSYYRDTFNWENVEVLRGPASVSFGRGSTGGVVNQVSKTPKKTAEKSAEVSLGSNNGQRLSIDINEPLPQLGEGIAFRLNAMEETSDVTGRDIAKINHWGVAPSLALGMGTATRINLSYLHESQNDTPDYGIPWLFNEPAPVDRNNYYGFKSDFLNVNADIFTAQIEHDLNDDMILRNQLRYGHYKRDVRITAGKIAGSPTTETDINSISITRSIINRESTETFLQNQLDLTASFKIGDIEHNFVIGVEAGRETSNPTRYTVTGVPTTNLVNPNTDDTFSGTYTAKRKTTVSSDSLGLYALDTVKLNEQWQLIGGVRWDQFSTQFKEESANPIELSAVDSVSSWRGAIVHKPTEEGCIYLGYGTSFNPSAESLSLSAGNAGLAPEENNTYELGTKWDLFKKKLSLRAALFQTDKKNARETVDDTVLLAGHHQVQGVELETTGQLSDDWNITMGYAHMQSKVLDSTAYPDTVGEPLANVPENTFSIWSTYTLPWNLQAGLGANFVDARRSSSTAPFDATTGLAKEVPSYWLFSAMMSYQVSPESSLQFNIYNLADTLYYDQVHNGHVVPGAGRTYVASFKMNF